MNKEKLEDMLFWVKYDPLKVDKFPRKYKENYSYDEKTRELRVKFKYTHFRTRKEVIGEGLIKLRKDRHIDRVKSIRSQWVEGDDVTAYRSKRLETRDYNELKYALIAIKDVLTLSVIRKKYKGKKVDLSKLDSRCFYNQENNSIQWEYRYVYESSGNENTYDAYIELNEDLTIKFIDRLYCRRLLGDDARSVSYRNCKPDEYDYAHMDRWLAKIVQQDETKGEK